MLNRTGSHEIQCSGIAGVRVENKGYETGATDCSETSKTPMTEMANESERHEPRLDSPGKQIELVRAYPIDSNRTMHGAQTTVLCFLPGCLLFMLPADLSADAVRVQRIVYRGSSPSHGS